MAELIRDFLVQDYVGRLEMQLLIRGLSQERISQVTDETRAHLHEMFDNEDPRTVEEYEGLLRRFGPADGIAKGIAREYEGARGKRRFWWPALFTCAVLLLLSTSYAEFIAKALGYAFIWTIILVPTAVLLVLGYIARRPCIGQFAALMLLLPAGSVLYGVLFTYPIGYYDSYNPDYPGPTYYRSVYKWDIPNERHRLATEESGYHEVARELKAGESFYAKWKAPVGVPSYLMLHGRYLLPDGVAHIDLSQSDFIAPVGVATSTYVTPSFKEARTAWSGWAGRQNIRDLIAKQSRDYQNTKKTLAFTYWVENQSWSTRVPLLLRPFAPIYLVLVFEAFLVTNLGWLLWLWVRTIGRWLRRRHYAKEPARA